MVFLGVGSVSTPAFAAPAAPAGEETSKKSAAAAELRVDLNTATGEELTALPGIGDTVSARIVTYRNKNGRFTKVEELMNVKGIGEKTFLRLRPYVIVEASSKGTK
jgi:competence protein ComEA